jgi:hypothetical protein
MSSENETLNRLGWSDFFEENFAPYKTQGLIAGRVTLEFNQFYRACRRSAIGSRSDQSKMKKKP